VKTFWMEPTDRVCVFLRRYTYEREGQPKKVCPTGPSWGHEAPHDAWLRLVTDEDGRWHHESCGPTIADDDPRWPRMCAHCAYEFQPDDARVLSAHTLYAGAPDGIRRPLLDFPVGATYNAEWLNDIPRYTGADGLSVICVTPGGIWLLDSRASNCTLPTDEEHKCWCRHGDPRQAQLTVDKSCKTCAAGGGSIQAGSYHGFLRDGVLVTA
jgi:hypothetical protein